jgi:hypothetical protein
MRSAIPLLSALLLSASAHASTVLDLSLPVEDFRAHGSQSGDGLTRGAQGGAGLIVADVDGDGVPDLITSSCRATPSPDRIAAGIVYVIRGPIVPGTHLDDIGLGADLRVLGATAHDGLGIALAVGDLNGDGVPDLAIGQAQDRDRGGVSILFGPLSWSTVALDLRSTAADWVLTGSNPSDLAGTSLAIGDLDGDGVSDLVVGIPFARVAAGLRTNAGEVRVFFGPLTRGTAHVPVDADLVISGPQGRAAPGAGASELGNVMDLADLDADGRMDLILGMPDVGCRTSISAECRGEVVALLGPFRSGARDLLTQPPDVTVMGRASDVNHGLGLSIAVADVNGDGHADLVMGGAGNHVGDITPAGGEIDIVSGPFGLGSVRDLDVTPPDVLLEGIQTFSLLASRKMLQVGDINGDGVPDIVAGAPYSDPVGRIDAGRVVLRLGPFSSGPFDDDTATVHILGRMAGDQLGSRVVLHDLDGDGKSDLVLGAGSAERPDIPGVEGGALYVLFGEPGNRAPHCVLPAMIFECGSLGACTTGRRVELDGSASWDADQDLARYDWTIACGAATTHLAGVRVEACLPVTCASACEVTLSLTDSRGNHSSCDAPLAITDSVPPDLHASVADSVILWPPNHAFITVSVSDLHPVVQDDCDPDPQWRLVGCTSDQPLDDRGDGHFQPDCIVNASGTQSVVRAERSGVLGDRHVTLLGVATDACGNTSERSPVGVVVIPHDRRRRP